MIQRRRPAPIAKPDENICRERERDGACVRACVNGLDQLGVFVVGDPPVGNIRRFWLHSLARVYLEELSAG